MTTTKTKAPAKKSASKKPAGKKAPAKKAAAKKSNGKGGVWALSDFANDDVITVVTAKPYEDGSVAASRFRLFKSGQTVGECLDAQRDAGFLRRRVAIRKAREAGHIKIEKAKAEKK